MHKLIKIAPFIVFLPLTAQMVSPPSIGGGGGSGTVTHTAGALCGNAIVTGNGLADLKTVNCSVLLDSFGNISTPGSISAGVGGTVAGGIQMGQGTAATPGANSILIQAPTSVTTAYSMSPPSAAGTGFILNTDTANVDAWTFIPGTGTGNVLRASTLSANAPWACAPVSASGTSFDCNGHMTLPDGTAVASTEPGKGQQLIFFPDVANTGSFTIKTGAIARTAQNGAGIAFSANDFDPINGNIVGGWLFSYDDVDNVWVGQGSQVVGGAGIGVSHSGIGYFRNVVSVTGLPAFPITTSSVTSGGIPYNSSTTQLSSSALLANNSAVFGGGAGAAPFTDTTTLCIDKVNHWIGIGTCSPVVTLDVAGTLNVQSSISLVGNLTDISGATPYFSFNTGGKIIVNNRTPATDEFKLAVHTGIYKVGTDTAATNTFISDASAQFAGNLSAASYLTATVCSNAASPAVCAAAAAGAVAIPTGVNPTLVVNTTAVTANSTILLTPDDSVTIAATTCNSTLATLVGGMAVTARTPGTSFTISYNGTINVNKLCVGFSIVN